MISYRQKNLVCFQEFIPNDGYDIRVIVVGNQIFGFYRKVPQGDFRASGMNIEEMRELPVEAMKINLGSIYWMRMVPIILKKADIG